MKTMPWPVATLVCCVVITADDVFMNLHNWILVPLYTFLAIMWLEIAQRAWEQRHHQ